VGGEELHSADAWGRKRGESGKEWRVRYVEGGRKKIVRKRVRGSKIGTTVVEEETQQNGSQIKKLNSRSAEEW